MTILARANEPLWPAVILEPLDPLAWVAEAGASPTGVHIVAYVRPPEKPVMEAPALRKALHARAEEAIAVVEAAGFRHERHPRYEVTGRMRLDDDEQLVPSDTKAVVEMWLRWPA